VVVVGGVLGGAAVGGVLGGALGGGVTEGGGAEGGGAAVGGALGGAVATGGAPSGAASRASATVETSPTDPPTHNIAARQCRWTHDDLTHPVWRTPEPRSNRAGTILRATWSVPQQNAALHSLRGP
jgi:hypothetical protein